MLLLCLLLYMAKALDPFSLMTWRVLVPRQTFFSVLVIVIHQTVLTRMMLVFDAENKVWYSCISRALNNAIVT